ncbi:MAG TPA: hypothetical protein VGE07_20030, partial [Herpetosiphonaceae bacterium]
MAVELESAPAGGQRAARERGLVAALCLLLFWASLLIVAGGKPRAEALPALAMLAGLFGLGWVLGVLRWRDGARWGLAAAALVCAGLALVASWSLRSAGWPWPFAGLSSWLVGGASAWMVLGSPLSSAESRSLSGSPLGDDAAAIRSLVSFPLGDSGAQVTVAHCAPERLAAVAEDLLRRDDAQRAPSHALLIPGQPRPLQHALLVSSGRPGVPLGAAARESGHRMIADHLGLELHALAVSEDPE